jgi:ATP-dependent protease ClpP protease subunit
MGSVMKLIVYVLFFFGFSASAEVVVQGDTIFVRGSIVEEHQTFRVAANDPNVKQVVFQDCQGGGITDGLVINKIIEMKKLRTVVDGDCISACAIAFMGGSIRSEKRKLIGSNTVGFHGARRINGVPDEKLVSDAMLIGVNKFMLSTIDRQSNFQLSEDVKSFISETPSATNGVYFRTSFGVFGKKRTTYHCPKDERQAGQYGVCKTISNSDPVALGIYTE